MVVQTNNNPGAITFFFYWIIVLQHVGNMRERPGPSFSPQTPPTNDETRANCLLIQLSLLLLLLLFLPLRILFSSWLNGRRNNTERGIVLYTKNEGPFVVIINVIVARQQCVCVWQKSQIWMTKKEEAAFF